MAAWPLWGGSAAALAQACRNGANMSTTQLLHATAYYPGFLRQFYKREPRLIGESYEKQLAALMYECFGWADFWKTHLEAMGAFEVQVAVSNAEPLQRAWAREHGHRVQDSAWRSDILCAQIAYYQPAVVVLVDGAFDGRFARYVKQTFRCVKLIGSYDGLAGEHVDAMRGFDFVLACLENTARYYSQNGLRGYYFKRAFESGILDRLPARGPVVPVSFIGSMNVTGNAHWTRIETLGSAARRLPLVWYGERQGPWEWFRRLCGCWRRADLSTSFALCRLRPALRRLERVNQAPVYGLRMYQALRDSLVSLNVHIDSARMEAGNMRLFEATGVGTCLVTDWKENLQKYFEPDREVVVYKCCEELVEKVMYLLGHPAQREAIATAGQRRCLRDHRLVDEVQRLGDTIRHWL